MGDMKTPDFDDLLAAFDIPDIETIESSPEEENSDTEGAPGGKDKTTYPSDQSDVPAVSVIVKNTVRTDTPGTEKEKRVHNDFKTQNDSTEGDSQAADPELCNIEDLSKVSNGLKGNDSNTMSNIEPVPQQLTGSLSTTFEHESKTNDTTVPLQLSQDAKDSIKPLFNTKLSTIGSISPVLSPSQVSNPNTSTPSPYNIKTRLNHFNQSDEEYSDPDLEGALVIQESPESAESAIPPKRPKLKHKPDVNLYLSDSSEKISNSIHTSSASLLDNSDLKNEAKTGTPSQAAPLPCPPPLVKDEKYPEHVIDERDSPESPPPSETGMLVPRRSPELPQTNTECTEQRPKECEASKDTAEMTEEMNSEIEEKFTSTVTDPPSLGPVKVKMKRSARAGCAKRGGRTKTEAVKTIKAESATRPRRKSMKQSKEEAATAGKGTKIKLSSAPEISLKTTAKVTAAGITLRSLGQKTLPGGVTLPLPSLLPPLSSSSRPASIVNSTGAIISKSQTNLVEAFNRILNNKNLLPSYKPDLASSRQAEWGLSLPAQGYRCLECGDSFALEQSLARHYDRRSLRIEVTCNHCAKRLAFFNKCSLLLHAREHKERGLIMQCSHLVMKPVPVEQMIGPHEPAAAAVLSSVLSNVNPNTTSVRKTEEVQYGNHKCPECQTQFSGGEEVAKHFQELKSQTTTCTECSPPMLLSNSCCAAAHQRIHLNSAPHVCPECGGTSKPPTFKTHLEETCFHFARRIGYRCSSCLVVFGGINSVKSHIQQAHCDMFQKCPICPMAFKSAPSIQNHITAQHPTLTDTQAISIFKCVMCDTVFTNKNLLYIHFDTHLANQKVHVFKCPECPKQFSVRSSLMDHLKTHHTKVKQESPLLAQSQPSVKMESSEGEEWSTPAKEATPQKTRKHFPCTKCESSFSTTSNLRRHIRDKHKTVARSFRCQFCTDMKKTFSSRAMLEKHIKLRHTLEARDQDFVMEGGDEADSSSEQDGGSVFRRRRRAAINSEQEEESVQEVRLAKKWRSSSALSSDPQIEKGFRCAPCGYTCEEQAEFLEHISQHRKGAGGSSQQCLQCGVCFTSNHSLSRHRFIVHRVRDQESQETTNTCPTPSPNENHEDNKCVFSAPESPALSQGKDSEGALACKVCGKHFEKATDLNTHFRTHGMAFINARNTAKTT
ncbi:zinc finger protein 687a isoform X2 [Periophthalmus magnuspinnatus]|uniref:zinc finger protein 687a isoform X2 n=1 Tax=Periophthalmus magnuspinnatus TaxID=409849 RepID=UPI00145B5620|nr:zinc finger protein 687a isoform X2 [Periophthalmus magnuspinnatus]